MFKISYKRDGNAIYAFFNSHPVDDRHEYKWYSTLVEHFQHKYPYFSRGFISNCVSKYLSNDKKYYGTAKCHPDDIFNEYRGEQLARHRLIMKYLRDVNRINSSICNHIRKELDIYD